MFKIPIKIKKGNFPAEQIADELKVDLRNNQVIEQKQPLRKWLFLGGLLLTVIICLCLSWWFFSSQKMAWADLLPPEAVVFSLIDQEAFYEQISSSPQLLENFYIQRAINQIGGYLNQAELNFKEDIQPLFKKQVVFILMPVNNETSFPFILLFETKASTDKISQTLDKIEPNLKEDYNFSSQIYRQIKLTILESLSPWPVALTNLYAYTQIENYFMISNSQEILMRFIDSVIDK